MNLKEKFFDIFNLYIEKKTLKKDISKVLKKLLPYKIEFDLIRLGNNNDGGYLIPDDLSNITKNYSAGVGNLTKFENDLEEKYSISSNMVDFNYVDPKILPISAIFQRKKIGITSDEDNLSINDWLDDQSGDIILKMDIEGDEYLTLSSISDKNLNKIRILIVELHDLRHLRNYFFYKTFEKFILKLNNLFYVCHLHVNNVSKLTNIGGYNVPDMLEITFIRKDRIKNFTNKFASIPHKLDQKTVLNQKELNLDKNWYL